MAASDYITTEELDSLSRGKTEDAEILFCKEKYDTCCYLTGYAVELKLKRRICLTLGWKEGYPKTNFPNLGSFKTHKLDVLLRLSGIEEKIKKEYFSIWSVVVGWDPEMRYTTQNTDMETARNILEATKALMEIL